MGIFDFLRSGPKNTASTAKERLRFIVLQERTARGGPDYLPELRRELLALIQKYVKVDLDAIALDDEPTFELIRASDTLGCFQIESPGQRELLQKLQPTRWADLIVPEGGDNRIALDVLLGQLGRIAFGGFKE